MHNKNKKGFTLSEVLISVTIVGVIMAMSIPTIKTIKTSYSSIAYFVFKNMEAAVSTIMAEPPTTGIEGKMLDRMTLRCRSTGPKTNGTIITILRGYESANVFGSLENMENCPTKSAGLTQSPIFCEGLASLSTARTFSCNSLYPITTASNGDPKIQADYKTAEPNFITTNGQRFYVSKWDFNSNVSTEFGYRLVAVDLNGTRMPNTDTTSGVRVPDIVNFLILDNGEIFPLGAAADDIRLMNGTKRVTYRYITSKINGYYYDFSQARSDDVKPLDCKNNAGCNYGIIPASDINETGHFAVPYRVAYCASKNIKNDTDANQRLAYPGYCYEDVYTPIDENYCPPTTDAYKANAFDVCKPDPIKPVFRFNFK